MTVTVPTEDLESKRQAILQEYGQNEEEALQILRSYNTSHHLRLRRTRKMSEEEKKAAWSSPEALEDKAAVSKYNRVRRLEREIEERSFGNCTADCFLYSPGPLGFLLCQWD